MKLRFEKTENEAANALLQVIAERLKAMNEDERLECLAAIAEQCTEMIEVIA
jgi:hypothetical protein